ncbi:hypothetical protein [Legionella quateirensis]|uniref:Uncharacterized protein n=1 Tax=Legionella quateirensis TaxID=45072 RepID=A0A378KZL3_9GAMM|nr:hypothetical protein [Legionella quateirensis]KTD43720.1 hypothetical protein Lqua_3074 [Legionella quateirensis]STY17290.1 Uncharacterised protein [Legionella quateirensis]
MPLPAHSQLLGEVNTIISTGQITKKNQILSELKKQKYNRALQIACEHCKPENKIQLKLISAILRYSKQLSIDVNKKYLGDGMTPIGYAIFNNNFDLYYLLKNAGANPDIRVCGNQIPSQIFQNKLLKSTMKLNPLLDKESYNKICSLYADSTRLPTKESQAHGGENAKFDIYRIEFMILAISHLMNIYRNETMLETLSPGVSVFDREVFKLHCITQAREVLEKVCSTVHNLSGAFRNEYSKYLLPSSLTWVTLEQFGGLIKNDERKRAYFIPIGSVNDPDQVNDLTLHMPSIHRFIAEHADFELLVEEAIPYVVKNDLPSLKMLFEHLAAVMKTSSDHELVPFQLRTIKALTSHLKDNFTLVNLINLMNYSENEHVPLNQLSEKSYNLSLLTCSSGQENRYQKRFNLTTLAGQHAALRRLQLIGEQFTGKNFSSFLCKLDNTVDWQAFITLRDIITHQEEGDNKHKVDLLLSDVPRLKKIVGEELSYFWSRLLRLIELREKKMGLYTGDPELRWKSILDVYEHNPAPTPTVVKPAPVRRVSLEEEQQFMKALKDKKAPDDVLICCQGLFNGIDPIPDQKVQGQICFYLPKAKEDRVLNKLLKGIMKKAVSAGVLTKQERINQRALQTQAKSLIKNQFTGLDEIRKLAAQLAKAPCEQYVLNPLKRVNAAIDALLNIRRFLVELQFIYPELPWTTLEEWDKYHKINGHLSYVELMTKNHQYKDAIEYNVGQLLQHMDRVRELQVVVGNQYILERYPVLRVLRNFIEHGNPLKDNNGFLVENTVQGSQRQAFIAPFVIELIYKMLPELIRIKEKISPYEAHQSPLVSDSEHVIWTECLTRYSIFANGVLNSGQNAEVMDVPEPGLK